MPFPRGRRRHTGADAIVRTVNGAAEYPSAEVEGFRLHMFVSYEDCGDALVVAPDGRTAGLIWGTGQPAYFRLSIAPDSPDDVTGRWGTYAVQQPLPLTTDDQAAAYLAALLPELRQRWLAWRNCR